MIIEPVVITFYSFKDRVGRSMALLNMAYQLIALGRNVLIVDMDLKTPGMSGFMNRKNEIPHFPRCDMLDLLQWARTTTLQVTDESPLDPDSLPLLSDYAVRLSSESLENVPDNCHGNPGRLDVIPSDVLRNYDNRLSAVTVESMDRQTLLRVGRVLRSWITSRRFPLNFPDYYGPLSEEDRFAPYDYVLIDSSTGSTEAGGLCIGPLSDHLVVLCGLDDQEIADTRQFLIEWGVLNPQPQPTPQLDKPTLFVASRVPAGETTLKSARLERMKQQLGPIVWEVSDHPRMALMETVFLRDSPDDDLATPYWILLDCLLDHVGDEGKFDPNQLEPVLEHKSFRPETREILRTLLRSTTYPPAAMFYNIVGFINLESVTIDDDFRLLDGIYRALTEVESSMHCHFTIGWTDMLVRWSQCSSDAGLADQRFAEAIKRIDPIINSAKVSLNQRTQALVDRGRAFGQRNEIDRAIADYASVIEMSDAPTEQKANALFNRGWTLIRRNEFDSAIADFTAVIKLPGATTEQKANAHVIRGRTFGLQNEFDRAIEDYTSAIEMTDVPSELKVKAHVNRGLRFGQRNELDRAIADYTAVIEMPDAPAKQKAIALFYRGLTFGERNLVEQETADYTALIEIADAPAELKADALINRGLNFDNQNEFERAIADYTAAIELPDSTLEQKADALDRRGWRSYSTDRFSEAIADFRQAVLLDAGNVRARGNLATALLVSGEESEALANYDAAIDLADNELLADFEQDLSDALAKHGTLAGADQVRTLIDARAAKLLESTTESAT